MTRKVYKTAMGREVDMGALMLQNENTRAIGNMNVNARGDQLDSSNKVTDQKNRQVQRQYQKSFSNVSADPVLNGTRAAQAAKKSTDVAEENPLAELDEPSLTVMPELVVAPEPLPENTFGPTGEGGLAAAIARSRIIKQEKEKTLRERQQAQGLRKI
jgi:hypothetical protein